MKKVSVLGILVEASDWILHPFAYHKELMEYRRDYDKQVLSFQKERERLQTLCKNNAKKCSKKTNELHAKIETKDKIIQELNDKIIDLEAVIENNLETINKVRGKIGGTTKKCNRLKKENENLKELLSEAREKLIESNKKIIEKDEKIQLLSKKTTREKIDYTLMKRRKNEF